MSRVLVAVLALAGLLACGLWFVGRAGEPRGTIAPVEKPAPRPGVDAGPELVCPEEPASETTAPAEASAPSTREGLASRDEEPAPAHWVEGRVIFPPNTPADEEAFVIAEGHAYPGGRDERAPVEPDGSFRVAIHGEALYVPLALDARYLRLAKKASWKNSVDAPVVLEPELGARLTGRLVLPPGVEWGETEAHIRLDASEPSVSNRSVPVSTDLGFAFDALAAPLSYTLVFDGTTWVGWSAFSTKPGESHLVELDLRPGVRLAGRVVDEEGAPLGGAKVEASSESSDALPYQARRRSGKSSEDGTFALRALGPGVVSLEALLGGLAPATLVLGRLDEGEERTELEIVLTAGHSIAGTVRWPDGSPAEAALELTPVGNGRAEDVRPRSLRGSSDETGRFEVTGLGEGPYRVHASATWEERVSLVDEETSFEGMKTERTPMSALQESVEVDTLDLELALSAGLTVRGFVVDDLGRPMENFDVFATRTDGGERGRPDHRNKESFRRTDGGFAMPGFGPGEWELVAQYRKHAASEPVSLSLPGSGEVRLIVPREATVSGIVLDPSGEPVQGARLRASRPGQDRFFAENPMHRPTDERGAFEMDGLRPGAITLTAQDGRSAPSEPVVLELVAGEARSDLVLRLTRGATILGRVLDGAGRGIPGLEVEVSNRRQTTDDEGCIEAHGLPAGEHRVRVTMLEGIQLTKMVPLGVGETARVEFRLPSSAPVRLHGTVSAGSAEHIGGDINANSGQAEQASGQALSLSSITEGRYELTLPGPGTYSLWLNAELEDGSRLSWMSEVEAPAVQELTHDISIPVGRISGHARDAEGRPLAGVSVHSSPEYHRPIRYGSGNADTNEDGYYELIVPVGRHSLLARRGGPWSPAGGRVYAQVRRDGLDVPLNGQLDSVDFVLVPGGALEGGVYRPDGSLAPLAVVLSRGPEGTRAIGSATEGSFHIDGLDPGPLHVSAHAQGLTTSQSLRVEIVAGETRRIELHLARGATQVHVAVRDEQGAFLGCDIDAVDAGGLPIHIRRGTTGEAWLGPLSAGRYTVRARRDEQRIERELVLSGEETEMELELRFE